MKPVDKKVLEFLKKTDQPALLSHIVDNVDLGRVKPFDLIKRLMDSALVSSKTQPFRFEITQKARRFLVEVPEYSRTTAQHKIWTIMRMARKFTVDDILQDLPEDAKPSRRIILAYLNKLEAVGYIGFFGSTSSTNGGSIKRYILLEKTGVKAPAVFADIDGIYDYNLKPKDRWVVPATAQAEVA